MKLFFTSLILISTSALAMPINQPTTAISGISLFATSSYIELPQTRNRKGSHRVGGRNSHGKGSHYRGGR
jgi:hypothetical protein